MEACIGMVITKSPIGGGSSTSPLRVLQASDDPGATDSGARTVDFMPGMVYTFRYGNIMGKFVAPDRTDFTIGYEPIVTT